MKIYIGLSTHSCEDGDEFVGAFTDPKKARDAGADFLLLIDTKDYTVVDGKFIEHCP